MGGGHELASIRYVGCKGILCHSEAIPGQFRFHSFIECLESNKSGGLFLNDGVNGRQMQERPIGLKEALHNRADTKTGFYELKNIKGFWF